jgi:hypothetical protein
VAAPDALRDAQLRDAHDHGRAERRAGCIRRGGTYVMTTCPSRFPGSITISHSWASPIGSRSMSIHLLLQCLAGSMKGILDAVPALKRGSIQTSCVTHCSIYGLRVA